MPQHPAAPTFLPAQYYFGPNDAATSEIRSFDLNDGEVAANNPKKKAMDSKQMLVLSLGTGEAKKEKKYNAATASEWGLLNWVYDNGKMPLLDVYCDASSDIVDFHVSTLFQCFSTKGTYL
ncbi:hypothetical protein QYF36_013693 [Acer negundo]|nr:hypothetical protein QYF36_013693 [Acer negundo]